MPRPIDNLDPSPLRLTHQPSKPTDQHLVAANPSTTCRQHHHQPWPPPLSVKVTGFERLKDDYESCLNFGELYTSLSNAPQPILDDYTLQDGYLFKANKLCIPWSSVRDFLVWEIHVGGLAGHFGWDKTIEEVVCQFYWHGLKRGIAKIVGQCRTCQLDKHR